MGKKGRGRENGREFKKGKRKGKRGKEKGKGSEVLIFFPREKGRLDFLHYAKGMGIEKGGNAWFSSLGMGIEKEGRFYFLPCQLEACTKN